MTSDTVFTPAWSQRLESPADGWFDVDWAVTEDGALATLRATVDVCRRHIEGVSPIVPPETRARLHVAREWSCSHIDVPFDPWGLAFDNSITGGWVVADLGSESDLNGVILSPDGECLQRLKLGQYIVHLQLDADGAIWVGYVDQADQPAGLVRFERTGEISWDENRGAGADWILDCYALNVIGREAWACTYTDFPIRCADGVRNSRVWANPNVPGVRALAVSGQRVVTGGGYPPYENRIALLELRGEEAVLVSTATLAEPPQHTRWYGRGDTLHAIGNQTWRKFSVEEVVEALL
jgi:hypothetical protein